jgi:dolichyl-phosphate-mannose-protein mannosyltransferase
MISNPPRLDSGLSRESLVVIALTLVGAVIRLWSFGRIGLIHFDEGIYALAGLWILSPRGLLDLDPNVIAYAPPGFSFLVGLSYLFFGVGDVAAVLASIVAGTLTIPAVGWVARRTFGSGAGAAAAALAALSGAHIAFSRMALVDASFLLFWVIAIGQGQRFLERPNAWRAMALGVAVGIAQLFKYSGWVSGVIVPLSAGLWLLAHLGEIRSRTTIATWGWGLVAAFVAAVVYWPWYRFVDTHGGYSALLAHHRGYLGGLSSWPGHLSIQLEQAVALSGGPVWWLCGSIVASAAMLVSVGGFVISPRILAEFLIETLMLTALCMNPERSWLTSLIYLSILMIGARANTTHAVYFLLAGSATLLLLTPFYHPYARLWLPVQACSWICCGGGCAGFRTRLGSTLSAKPWMWKRAFLSDACLWSAIVCCAALVRSDTRREVVPIGVLEPSDSVRLACQALRKSIPKNVKSLRIYARRPVTYYLALDGGIAVFPQPDLDHLLEQGDRTSWALLDSAMLPQNNVSETDLPRSMAHWVEVEDFPTTLNMATLLDIEPAAARNGAFSYIANLFLPLLDIEPAAARSGTFDMLASLRLLRPKRAGDTQ